MAGLLHQSRNSLNKGRVLVCEVCCRGAFAASTTRSSNSVDIADQTLREIEVEDGVNSLEINATSHQIGANQDPDVSHPELLDYFITLLLLLVSVNHVHIQVVEKQLFVKFFCALFGLDKDEHGRGEALL